MPAKKIKVLIVDDEKDNCHFMSLILKKRGFWVYCGLSGTKAIAMAKKVKPQLALIDVHLKTEISGLEVLRQIKERIPQCHCVMVTWDKSPEKTKEAKRLGAEVYLTKPVVIAKFLKVILGIARKIEREVA